MWFFFLFPLHQEQRAMRDTTGEPGSRCPNLDFKFPFSTDPFSADLQYPSHHSILKLSAGGTVDDDKLSLDCFWRKY